MHLTTDKQQLLQVSMSTYAHNLIGSKELIQTLKHMRIGIPYNDALNELLLSMVATPQKGVATICHLQNNIFSRVFFFFFFFFFKEIL